MIAIFNPSKTDVQLLLSFIVMWLASLRIADRWVELDNFALTVHNHRLLYLTHTHTSHTHTLTKMANCFWSCSPIVFLHMVPDVSWTKELMFLNVRT